MKLLIEPLPAHRSFHADLELVICVNSERPPQIFSEHGLPKPDRHLLLGIVQSVAMAIEERDRDLVEFCKPKSLRIERGTESKDLACDLIISRSLDGLIGAIAPEDTTLARNL